MDMGWVMGVFFVVLIVIYAVVALLAPEWVGIQGKMAKKIEDSHREPNQDSVTENKKTDL
jgi:hypothetical protein